MKSSGKKISGLEYYFARYREDDEKQPNRQTIVLFPTYEGVIEDIQDKNHEQRGHIPFDPDNTKAKGRNITMKEIYRDGVLRIDSPDIKSSEFGDSELAYNRSQMSPPRPPDTL